MSLRKAIKDALITPRIFSIYCRVDILTMNRWCDNAYTPIWVWELIVKLIIMNDGNNIDFWNKKVKEIKERA